LFVQIFDPLTSPPPLFLGEGVLCEQALTMFHLYRKLRIFSALEI
jgi:hypothetical protein